MTSKIIVNNIESDAGVSTVFFNSDIGATDGTLNVDGNLTVDGVITYEDVTNIDSVGIITAQSNVVIADKIIHLNDTNTAIRFPAADTFTVETSGSEALRVDLGGRLLSGTISNFDNYKTQISSTAGSLLSVRRTNSNPGSIKISSGASGDNVVFNSNLGYIRWYGFHTSTDYEAARISVEVDDGPGANDMPGRLIFSTTSNGAASPTERLRITSDGDIGIGNNGNFPIYTGTNDRTLILGTGSEDSAIQIHSSGTGYGGVYFGDSTSGNARYSGYVEFKHGTSDDFLRFGTASTERLRIDSNGRILVGPGAVATPKCGYAGIDIPNYDYSIVMGGSDGNGNRANNTIKDGRFCGAHYNNAEEPVGIIRYSIGSTASELHMGGGSSLINAATQLSFYTAANTTTTNGLERLRITSAGKVCIGSASDEDLQFGTDVNAILQLSTTSAPKLILCRDDTSVATNDYLGMIDFHSRDGGIKRVARIGARAGGNHGADDGPTDLVFHTMGDNTATTAEERLRITYNGDVSISSAGTVHGVSKLTILPANRTSAFSASDGDTWHDVVLKQTGSATNNAVGIAFAVSGDAYHKNAATGIAAVKNGTNSDYGSDLVFITRPQSAVAQERLRISSAGNVGINCTNPQRPLHIIGNDGTSGATSGNSDTTLLLDNTGNNGSMLEFLNSNNGAGHLMFTDTDATNRGRISYHHNGDYFRFDTNGTERVTINSDQIQVKSGVGFNWNGYLIEKVGEKTGSGTYSLWTNGTGSTQSSAIVEIISIYGTPSASAYRKYKVSGERTVHTIQSNTSGFPVTPPSLAWNGSTLEVTNNNGNIYFAVKIQLFEIGIGWAATWGNLPGL